MTAFSDQARVCQHTCDWTWQNNTTVQDGIRCFDMTGAPAGSACTIVVTG